MVLKSSDKKRKYQREYYAKNKELIREKYKDHFNSHKEEVVLSKRNYYLVNKNRILSQRKKYYEDNKDKIKSRMKTYYQEHPEHRCRKKSPEKNRAFRLRNKYGISVSDYHDMFKKQMGLCAICGKSEDVSKYGHLSIDHDHKTGRVRKLLCHHCNIGLGRFKDDIEILKKAIIYLEQENTYGN